MGVADFPQEDWDQFMTSSAGSQDFSILPVFVEKELYDNYYNGFSNSVLWPLFHYFSSLANYENQYFEAYVQVNPPVCRKDRADAPAGRPGLDPRLPADGPSASVAVRKPEATIGFFLHIPFPSYEIFRLLPTEWKKTLLQGLMGADLIGFHTYDYVQHFLHSAKMLLGVDSHFHNLQYEGRLVRIDLFPIGIDYNKFHSAATDPRSGGIPRQDQRKPCTEKDHFFGGRPASTTPRD